MKITNNDYKISMHYYKKNKSGSKWYGYNITLDYNGIATVSRFITDFDSGSYKPYPIENIVQALKFLNKYKGEFGFSNGVYIHNPVTKETIFMELSSN